MLHEDEGLAALYGLSSSQGPPAASRRRLARSRGRRAAALGLAATMVGAVLTHLRLGERSAVVPPVVLLVLAAFVAYGRFFILRA